MKSGGLWVDAAGLLMARYISNEVPFDFYLRLGGVYQLPIASGEPGSAAVPEPARVALSVGGDAAVSLFNFLRLRLNTGIATDGTALGLDLRLGIACAFAL
jgi:hypothetical protein